MAYACSSAPPPAALAPVYLADSVSQAAELRSLTQAGSASINLEHHSAPKQTGTDAQIARQSAFLWRDGRHGIAADIEFATNPTSTRFVGGVQIAPAVLIVKDIKGYGQMPNLHISINRDAGLKRFALNLFHAPPVTGLLNDFERRPGVNRQDRFPTGVEIIFLQLLNIPPWC